MPIAIHLYPWMSQGGLESWPLVFVLGKKLANQVFCFARDKVREGHACFLNFLAGLVLPSIFIFERRLAAKELIQQYSQPPYINIVIILLAGNNFWGKVIQRTTEGVPSETWSMNR